MTNESVTTVSVVFDLISNLIPDTEHHYCTILSDNRELLVKICGKDLPGGGWFRTDKPNPLAEINQAAEFDENTLVYTLNGTCASKTALYPCMALDRLILHQ